MEQTVSRTFELFENYSLKNVLLLPPTFSLPHRPAAPIASGEDAAMDEEIAQLLKELQLVRRRMASYILIVLLGEVQTP